MKKSIKTYEANEETTFVVSEPYVAYNKEIFTNEKQLLVKDFTFEEFKKIADLAPFNLKEWSAFLHTSERTLQRYAKDNSSFNGLQIERILLFKKLIKEGNRMFGKDNFGIWLNKKIFSLHFKKPKEMLYTHDGVQEVINILARIQHGIVA